MESENPPLPPIPEATRRRILSSSFKAVASATVMLLFPKRLSAPNTRCRPAICRPRPFSTDRCLPEIPCQPKLTPR
jgi:hypothetical protein